LRGPGKKDGIFVKKKKKKKVEEKVARNPSFEVASILLTKRGSSKNLTRIKHPRGG